MLYSFHISGFFRECDFVEECEDDIVANMVASEEANNFYSDSVESGSALSLMDIAENMYDEYLIYDKPLDDEYMTYKEYLDEYSSDIDNAVMNYIYDNIDVWYEPVTKEPDYDDWDEEDEENKENEDCYNGLSEEEYLEEEYGEDMDEDCESLW